MQTLLAFGSHDQEAPRHWTNKKWFMKQGYEVRECHVRDGGVLKKNWQLLQKFFTTCQGCDAVLVTFPGHYFVPLAWLLTRFRRRRLIFDAFISLYDVLIDDRRKKPKWHPYAWFLFFLDWLDCHLADEVLIDTEAHRQFFLKKFHLRPERVRVVYLYTRTDMFTPRAPGDRPREVFKVLFYGTFIPHQGIQYILEAAALLEKKNTPVHFTLIGAGQTTKAMKQKAEDLKLTTVTFEPPVTYKELPDRIRDADLCLGVFGTAEKVGRVIPHKVFDAVACGVPVLTSEAPAVRELYGEADHVYFCPAGDAEAIAQFIERLAKEQRAQWKA